MNPVFRGLRALARTLGVNVCYGCGERLEKGRHFCFSCSMDYESARMRECAACNRVLSACLCPTPLLRKHHVRRLYKLLPYRSRHGENGVNRMVLRIKHRYPLDTISFCAKELADAMKKTFAPEGDCLVTFTPRSRRTCLEYGYDQAEELAKALAQQLGLPFAKMLKRTKQVKEQKTLRKEARKENMHGVFALRRGAQAAGKHILLVDDIVTTGATMGEAASVLYAAGAGTVEGACLCVTL